MNPHSNESLQLPSPVTEQATSTGHAPEQALAHSEQAAAPERNNQAGSIPPPAMPSTIPLPTPPAMPATMTQAAATSQATPAQASDDADLIEKEWVTKAKQIVDRTRNDPYKQSEELTVYKADYMKKRYNKTVKVSK